LIYALFLLTKQARNYLELSKSRFYEILKQFKIEKESHSIEYKRTQSSNKITKSIELHIIDELKIENFTYNLFTIELDDGDISLLDDLHYNTKKLECIDFGESSGRNGILKIWKKSGEIFKIK
jgi:hypothetical protein